MIKDKRKEYGEVNHENTVTAANAFLTNKYLLGGGNKTVKVFNPGARKILYVNAAGQVKDFDYAKPNILIGTDASGNLVSFKRNVLPSTVPTNRELVKEVYGSTTPSGPLGEATVTLTAPFWYEVEVAGAGGGGGAGAVASQSGGTVNGKNGGRGGYYKQIFSVQAPVSAVLQAGCSGGAGTGWIRTVDGKSVSYTGNTFGGDGGRTPRIYQDGGNAGASSNASTPTNATLFGGAGKRDGARGGNSSGDADGTRGPGGAGGGANGPYGGNGGDNNGGNTRKIAGSAIGASGAGGGAGGGFGDGGAGGQLREDLYVGGGSRHYHGGSGYGGGGGGGASPNSSANVVTIACGGAGGGGGGSRFVAGSIEILCGGGGGGAGGGDSEGTNYAGGDGRNNKNAISGGGGGDGFGGVAADALLDTPANTNGTNGGRGWVRVWRCIS